MKKLFFTILCCFYVVMAYPQYITLKGKQLYDSTGTPFYVKGVNYAVDLFSPTADTSSLTIVRHHGYYQKDTLPTYSTQADYFKDITNDFKIIRNSLGCNTIRLEVGGGGFESCTATRFFTAINTGTAGQGTKVYSTSLNFLNPIYATLLDSAAAYGIKVVLLLYGNCTTCNANTSLYINYIAQTANALKTKKALLAYDECNEPEYSNGSNIPKEVVCSRTNTWYNTFKTYDPNHLVTVGLAEGGFGADAFTWSSDVYAADLYTFHIYPSEKLYQHTQASWTYVGGTFDTTIVDGVDSVYWVSGDTLRGAPETVIDTNYNYNNVSLYQNKFNATVRWIYNTTNLPWLIGETSFSASTHPGSVRGQGNYFKKNDGDTISQTDYMNNVLTVTKQAQGMGVIWWDYHDVSWFAPADPGGTYMGLVDSLGAIKPAGHALKNFDANSVAGPPPAYPSGYQNLDGNGGAQITGVVSGVPDALVSGWHLPGWQYAGTTPADASGNFSITSLTPLNPSLPNANSTTIINYLEMSAVGYDVDTCDGYINSANLYNGKSFSLNQSTSYNVTTSGLHLSANTGYSPFTSPGKINVEDFYVSASIPGGTVHTVTVTALGEIAILPTGTTDSYVASTAEAAFYNGFVFTDCSDATWSTINAGRQANAGAKPPVKAGATQLLANNQPAITNAKTVYLSPDGFLLQVYPNPATNMVLVQSTKSINFISISNIYGATVAGYTLNNETAKQLNIETLMPGTYMIKILYSDNTSSVTQIIKQ